MFDYRHYVPILHGKKGEFRALKELSGDTKQLLTPLIEIPPVDFDWKNNRPRITLDAHLKSKVDRIRVNWGVSYLFIDLFDMNLEERTSHGIHPLTYLFDHLRAEAIQAIPTTGLDRDDDYNEAVAIIFTNDERGVCLRILEEDMEFIQELSDKLDALMEILKVSRKVAHLLLDFRNIKSGDVNKASTRAINTINNLPKINEWQTLTVAASGMPQSLGEMVKTGSEGRITRVEFAVWTQILNDGGGLQRKPTYGDYGTRHPDLLSIDARRIAKNLTPSIRYASDNEWLILRGMSFHKHPDGYKQYHALSKDLIDRPEYKGLSFSWGDKYIVKNAADTRRPGSLTDWVAVSTNHHLTFVGQQIAEVVLP